MAIDPGVTASIRTTGGWLGFGAPARVLETDRPQDVRNLLCEVERAARSRSCHAVGFLSYDAGQAFGLPVAGTPRLPLAWFGLFEDPVPIDRGGVDAAAYEIGALTPSVSRPAFDRALDRIRHYLAEGDTYQVNYTFCLRGSFQGSAATLFQDLVAAQRGEFGAFVATGRHSICSASPELFFERRGSQITARPMKGTSRRGRTLAEDLGRSDALRNSAKQRAENVMIVDMVRNDLGKVAEVGSVAVPELFALERYPSLWQMTSTVTARSAAPLADIFAALHPSASVTGAPKARTMAIIAELEREPRGVYTGAIGYVAPDGGARFGVAIRTAVIDHDRQTVEFGIGSGVVWDSDAADEYEECLLKAAILTRRPPRFELLETLRWTPGEGYFLLDRHLTRLRDSAGYFGFPYDDGAVRTLLDRHASEWSSPSRVRLLLADDGTPRVEERRHEPTARPMRIRLAHTPVDERDVFLFHKTTNRAMYERHRVAGVDEILLWNSAREITEATTANVVVAIGGVRRTPPIECGLLGGTYRAELLARGEIEPGVITIDDLRRAERIWLINSVHEWREARLVD
jgi:para-aminobenzoate synthetase/4-amino-4-deoxychorismate lyase